MPKPPGTWSTTMPPHPPKSVRDGVRLTADMRPRRQFVENNAGAEATLAGPVLRTECSALRSNSTTSCGSDAKAHHVAGMAVHLLRRLGRRSRDEQLPEPWTSFFA